LGGRQGGISTERGRDRVKTEAVCEGRSLGGGQGVGCASRRFTKVGGEPCRSGGIGGRKNVPENAKRKKTYTITDERKG